jgi:hypothetical protein
MHQTARLAALVSLLSGTSLAQMTVEQKLIDFQQLVAVYAKQYAPYEWKRDGIGFDLLRIGPWLERVQRSKDDFEFLDLCAEYVASLWDGHSQFIVPSTFAADSGLYIDLYDGKVLVDRVDRNLLPLSRYPIREGDELRMVDGRPVAEWIEHFSRFASAGNARARARFAVDLIAYRPQYQYPRAHELEKSTFTFLRRDGSTAGFEIPWSRSGTPITAIGPVPNPIFQSAANAAPTLSSQEEEQTGDPLPDPLRFRGIPELRRAKVDLRAVRGIGAVQPVFAMPAGFVQRLGRQRDVIFSGTYTNSGLRIGFIRVGFMSEPGNPFVGSQQISQLQSELRFMQANTDGLILDVMRNPGGDPCLAQDLASLLIPRRFQFPGAEIRATRDWILRFENQIDNLKSSGLEGWITDLLTAMLGDIRGAYAENRGRTGPLPTCDLSLDVEPARDQRGNVLAYTRPLMVLVDDFTASAAEMFAAAIQDNARGKALGMPSMGAGGTVSSFQPTGWYSETGALVTTSLLVRPRMIHSSEFPAAPYIENIGIRPDVEVDFMTEENLVNQGRPFVQSFTEAMVAHIRGN